MKKLRFTDEPIIGFLKQLEAGAGAKELEGENGKLKKFLSEVMRAKTGLSVASGLRADGVLAHGAAVSGGWWP